MPLLQEPQAAFAAEQPNAAIAIINDLGNLADIVNFRVAKDRKGRVRKYGELEGRDVVVSAKGVSAPKRLRYLHSSPWYGALYSEVNLPVGAFHIDGSK